MHSKGKNVPAVGKRSRAIRPLPITSGIIAPVSKRAQEHCTAPKNSRAASARERLGLMQMQSHTDLSRALEDRALTRTVSDSSTLLSRSCPSRTVELKADNLHSQLPGDRRSEE